MLTLPAACDSQTAVDEDCDAEGIISQRLLQVRPAVSPSLHLLSHTADSPHAPARRRSSPRSSPSASASFRRSKARPTSSASGGASAGARRRASRRAGTPMLRRGRRPRRRRLRRPRARRRRRRLLPRRGRRRPRRRRRRRRPRRVRRRQRPLQRQKRALLVPLPRTRETLLTRPLAVFLRRQPLGRVLLHRLDLARQSRDGQAPGVQARSDVRPRDAAGQD